MNDDNANQPVAPPPVKAQYQAQGSGMPKWLLYGLIAKGIIVTCIVIGVLWYAGVIG